MNILTFDIEEWYVEKVWGGNSQSRYKKFDELLDIVLAELERRNTKATFFCLGQMAKEFSYVIRKIQDCGHEIGCHSHEHFWLNKMTREMAMEDTRHAVDALEQCIGKKVLSYRAPAFSIGKKNNWAFEILKECGIKRDASVFPAMRDFGGFPEFSSKSPVVVYFERGAIKEFPICTTKLLGKEIAYSGGGYFRFFPLSYIRKEMAKSDYSMTYFHIGDLVQEASGMLSKAEYENYFKEKGTFSKRAIRYVKTNLGKKSAMNKLLKLIASEDFVSLEQADSMIDWETVTPLVL